jgi:two-component system CheB/CheR fusion protein
MTTKSGRRLPSFPVGFHLAAYGLALILPVLIFSGLLLRYYAAAEHRRIEGRALAAARDFASTIDRDLAARVARLGVLAGSPAARRGDVAAFDEHARLVGPTDGYRIFLIDLSADGDDQTTWLVDLVRRRLPAEAGGAFVSDLAIPARASPQLVVGVPVEGTTDSKRLAVVSAEPPDRLRTLLQRASLDERWRVALLDATGRIITRSHDADRFETFEVPRQLLVLSSPPRGVTRTIGLEGYEVYRAHAFLTEANWQAVVSIPVESVEGPLQTTWRLFGLAGATLLGLSLVLAMGFGRAIAAPIQRVAQAARALGSGAPVSARESTVDEVNDVILALQAASRERRDAEEAAAIANEKTRLALKAGRMGTFEIDLKTGRVDCSPERLEIFGVDSDSFDGRLETLDRLIHPDDIASVLTRRDTAIATGSYESEFRIIRPDGSIRWLLSRGEVRRDADGTAHRVIGLSMDITARKIVERRLAEAAQLSARQLGELEALYASAPIGLALFDRDLRYVRANAAMATMSGVTRQEHFGRTARQVLGAVADALEPHLEHVLASGEARLGIEFEGEMPGLPGVLRSFNSQYYPLLDEGGLLVGVGLILEEVTDQRRVAERQKLLVRELRHRANNMLAVIQSVARRSLSGSGPIEAGRINFLERLQALARAHNMLTDSDWRGVALEELVRVELEGIVDRVDLDGPPIVLESGPAQTFALVLHELAVNAVKHGALSGPGGRVRVTWQITGTGAAARFLFRWEEYGGPPVSPPAHRGFGTELLERAIIEDFDKPAMIEFRPEGLLFEVDVPAAMVRT